MLTQNAIALFGGSFNPVHKGHIELVKTIENRCGFEKIYIIPTKKPPHKDPYEVDDHHRLEFIKIGFSKFKTCEISNFEMNAEGYSYAIRTIEHFTREHHPKPIFFILGADAFNDLPNWYAFPDVMEACSYVVVQREGWEPSRLENRLNKLIQVNLLKEDVASEPFARVLKTRSGTKICVFNVSLPEVSSTEIRIRLQHGQPLMGLVPDEVEAYLKSNRLYGTS